MIAEQLPVADRALPIRVGACVVVHAVETPNPCGSNRLALAAIVLFTLINVIYIAFACPHDLAPDEAHYWDWSRRLDYCYYSKGPMVAWLIRASCELLGDTVFAVRLPAAICGGMLLAGMSLLTLRAYPDRPRLALWTVLFAMTIPAFTATSVIMTIDPPMLALWAWAAVCIQRVDRWRGYWIVAGLLVAIGILTKPTMLLFPVCVGCYLVAQRNQRTYRFWSFLGISLLGLIPQVIWNLQHDHVGLMHLLGHASGDSSPGFLGLFGFLGNQLALLLGVWFLAWLAAAWHYRHEKSLLFWLSAPVVGAFWLASVRAVGQPNWAAPAYVTGIPLAVVWVIDHWNNRHVKRAAFGVAIVGVLIGLTMRWPAPARYLMAQVVPPITDVNPTPLRKFDPTARLAGWKQLAGEVDTIRRDLRTQTGEEPSIVGMTWVVPGELAFYCGGHPTVYCIGSVVGDRKSQYDLWRPNPIDDVEAFKDRTFIYIGDTVPVGVFAHSEKVKRVTVNVAGSSIAAWDIWICRGYVGFKSMNHLTRY